MTDFIYNILLARLTVRSFAVLLIFMLGLLITASEAPARGYWDAFLELGFDPKLERVDRALAYERIETLLQFRERVSEHLEVDKKMVSLIHDARSKVSSFDMGNLYGLLPYSDTKGIWRALGVRGGWDSADYRLWVTDPGIEQWLASFPNTYPMPWGRQKHFGDLGLRAFVRSSGKDTFRFVTEGQLHLADLPVSNMVRVIQGILKTAALDASRGQDPPSRFLVDDSLEKSDLRVLYALARDFPHLFSICLRYLEVEDIVSRVFEDADDVVRFDIKVRIDRQAFKEDYPELGKLFDRIKGMFHIKARILDDQNRVVAKVAFDTQDLVLRLDMAARGNQILMISDDLTQDKTAGFRLTEPGLTRFRCIFDIHLNLMGLHLDVTSLQMMLDYLSADQTTNLKTQLMQPPESVVASGYLMRFIPVWLIDLVIPSSIEDITRDFFRTMAESNGGRGAMLEYGNYPQKALNRNLWLRTDTEVLSNGMLKFAFKLSRNISDDPRALRKELHDLRQMLWKAFHQDYLRMRCQQG